MRTTNCRTAPGDFRERAVASVLPAVYIHIYVVNDNKRLNRIIRMWVRDLFFLCGFARIFEIENTYIISISFAFHFNFSHISIIPDSQIYIPYNNKLYIHIDISTRMMLTSHRRI